MIYYLFLIFSLLTTFQLQAIEKPSSDLAGKKIGMITGTSYIKLLTKLEPKVIIVTQPKLIDTITSLAEGKVDGIFNQASILYHMMEQNDIFSLMKIDKLYFPDKNAGDFYAIRTAKQNK
jgi:ABC-type amino acid transport substrate-binding protein